MYMVCSPSGALGLYRWKVLTNVGPISTNTKQVTQRAEKSGRGTEDKRIASTRMQEDTGALGRGMEYDAWLKKLKILHQWTYSIGLHGRGKD